VTAVAADLTVLQDTLAAEHAAVYGYGAAGAHLTGSARTAALAAYDVHRARRDRLRALLLAAGGQPVAAEPAYQLPFAVRTPAAAVQLAARLESAIAAAYVSLVAAATGSERDFAARAVQDAAARAARWQGRTAAFPGLPAAVSGSPSPTPSPS
jgi:Domain of unknown function (DUF4439)